VQVKLQQKNQDPATTQNLALPTSIPNSAPPTWPPHISPLTPANEAFVNYPNLHYDSSGALLPPVVSIANTDNRLLELGGTSAHHGSSATSGSFRSGKLFEFYLIEKLANSV
jgi:hypothetical protein